MRLSNLIAVFMIVTLIVAGCNKNSILPGNQLAEEILLSNSGISEADAFSFAKMYNDSLMYCSDSTQNCFRYCNYYDSMYHHHSGLFNNYHHQNCPMDSTYCDTMTVKHCDSTGMGGMNGGMNGHGGMNGQSGGHGTMGGGMNSGDTCRAYQQMQQLHLLHQNYHPKK